MSARREEPHERETDFLDEAGRLTQTLTRAAISNVQDAAAPEQTQRPDGSWPFTACVDCEDDIPAPRLALGKIRCVCCQEDREAWRASRARG